MKTINSSQKPFFLSFLIILLFCNCQLYAKQTKPKRSKEARKSAATAQPQLSEGNTIGKKGLTNSDSMAGAQKKPDIPGIVQRSDLIIRGKVISTESQWRQDARGEHIYTTITVKILDKIKGNIKDDTFTFEVIGGTDGEITEMVSDIPVFEVDEDVIVFLAKHPRTNKQVTNAKILIYDGRVYQDDMELTADSFIQSLKTLKKAPGTTGPWGKKYKVPAAKAENVPNIKDISFDEALAVTNKQVAITGTNFGSTQGSGKVKFFNKNKQQKIPASIVSWSDTQIICTVPANISAGGSPVTVTTNDGTSSSYDFMAAECFVYNYLKWYGTSPTVTYKINENTSDCYGEGAAVQRAAATWNAANSNFTLQYGGNSYCANTSFDSTNCIFWGGYSLPTYILARATKWYTGSEIVECEIEFNNYYYDWDTSPSSSEFDVESVALHELGHWLSLGDLYDDDDSDNVMYGYIGNGQIKRVLDLCDCDGICYIYGGYDCGCAYLTSCSIEGYKFSDTDGNGLWDSGEVGLQDWEIYLDLNDNGQRDSGEPNAITGIGTGADPNGFYEFSGLDGGTYIVAEAVRPGWTQTCPSGDGTYTIVGEEGSVYDGRNFGNRIGGDGIINFADWALFADAWQSTSEPPSANWDQRCDIAPQGGDGVVDIKDISAFIEQWLEAGLIYGDIASSPTGDGIVNMLDFTLLAEHWLEGTE